MSLKHDHVADLLWQLSPEDRTRILVVLLERYDLSDDCRVYWCKSCEKTGSTVHDHPMTIKFHTCEDCCEDWCNDCAEEKMDKIDGDYSLCKECAKFEENQREYFKCNSCEKNKIKNTGCWECKKCINLICGDCTGEELVKSCKTCHAVFCKVCRPEWLKNDNCVECRREREVKEQRERKEKTEREAKRKEKRRVKMATKK